MEPKENIHKKREERGNQRSIKFLRSQRLLYGYMFCAYFYIYSIGTFLLGRAILGTAICRITSFRLVLTWFRLTRVGWSYNGTHPWAALTSRTCLAVALVISFEWCLSVLLGAFSDRHLRKNCQAHSCIGRDIGAEHGPW